MNQKEQIIAELLENESFLKWLSGKGNATDNQFWQNWISENTLHEEAFREISETWSVLTFKPIFSDETDAEWQKLSNRLNLGNGASPAPQQPETYLQRRMNREIHSTRWWLGAGSAVAALFCLVALVWIGFFSGNGSNPMNRDMRTGNGEQVRIQLPDQSTVLLNANSALHFSDEWTTGSAVNVVLT
ncbi:MAG: FecR domain-containing protein, partial [Calditrichaeota bacterium]|nr:FecR domain-containing protein [Calditrichota bacterium]